jgi:hypothetical protein
MLHLDQYVLPGDIGLATKRDVAENKGGSSISQDAPAVGGRLKYTGSIV